MDESHKVHYERIPTHGARGFVVPRDVIKALGAGDEEIGNLVLLDTFGVHPMSAPLGAIHPDVVRAIGDGDAQVGNKVLRAFVSRVRKQHATQGKSTKAQAHYRAGTETKHCAICTMFRSPDACTKVRGKISAQALCDYFEKAHAAVD